MVMQASYVMQAQYTHVACKHTGDVIINRVSWMAPHVDLLVARPLPNGRDLGIDYS